MPIVATPPLKPAPSGLALALMTVISASSALATPPTYRVEVVGRGLQGFDMNASLTVVGRAVDAQGIGRAFVARRGDAPALLPFPAEFTSSDAYAISPNGIVVGAVSTVQIASIGSRAAAWYPNGKGYDFVLLPPLPGDTHGAAFGVNSHGDIVGGSGGLGLGSYPRAARFTPKGATPLPEIGTPADVNESRVVLASNQRLDLDTMTVETIPLPPGNWQGFVGLDLADSGHCSGYVLGFSGCSTFPVRYLEGSGWEFVGGCATTTAAGSINARGDCSGYVLNGGIWMSFVGETNVAPGELLAESEAGWFITGLGTVTDGREILASGRFGAGGTTQLLRLVPEPAADLDGDGRVNAADLAILLGAWGTDGAGDLDGDGAVGAADLALLLGAWSR